MEAIILGLCAGRFLTLPVMCQLLNRQPDPLRKTYLKPMTARNILSLAFPSAPTDPRQAYTAVTEGKTILSNISYPIDKIEHTKLSTGYSMEG